MTAPAGAIQTPLRMHLGAHGAGIPRRLAAKAPKCPPGLPSGSRGRSRGFKPPCARPIGSPPPPPRARHSTPDAGSRGAAFGPRPHPPPPRSPARRNRGGRSPTPVGEGQQGPQGHLLTPKERRAELLRQLALLDAEVGVQEGISQLAIAPPDQGEAAPQE